MPLIAAFSRNCFVQSKPGAVHDSGIPNRWSGKGGNASFLWSLCTRLAGCIWQHSDARRRYPHGVRVAVRVHVLNTRKRSRCFV